MTEDVEDYEIHAISITVELSDGELRNFKIPLIVKSGEDFEEMIDIRLKSEAEYLGLEPDRVQYICEHMPPKKKSRSDWQCQGCAEDQPAQMAHMGPGGCLESTWDK